MIRPLQKMIMLLDEERRRRPSVQLDSLISELIDARDGGGDGYDDICEVFKYVH